MITSKNGNIDIIKLLLEKEGIDINAKNNKGMTAILLAADFGMKNMVDFLSTIEGIEYDKEKADKLILNPQQKHLRRNLRNVIFNKVDHCSAEQTGRDYLNDRSYFLCLTCKILPPYSICRECARVCHKGHHMMEIELTNNQGFFCDCGVGDCVLECKLMHTHKHKKETDE